MSALAALFFVAYLFQHVAVDAADSPNIIFLVYDDLGWTDVSYNGGQIPTPNMDDLFANGIDLQRHYIHLICSISRSQLLTGRYAMYSGYGKMSPFGIGHIGGIPMGLPTLPQWLKAYNAEYTTYGVGKWHLGYASHVQLPKNKGFDHFFGPYSGAITYDSGKIVANKCDGCNGDRYDLHLDGRDYDPEQHKMTNTMYDYRDQIMDYLDAEAETETPFFMFLPLQSPHGPLDRINAYHSECSDLVDGTEEELTHRTKYCDVIRLSDDIIGDMVTKLKDTGLWDNTLFVMTTDNGGDIENTGCNYPFRGTKGTLFEGNQRVVSVVSGGLIPEEQRGTKRQALVSGLDWTPTFLRFAGILDDIDEEDQTWDGVDQYDLLMHGDDYENRHDRDHVLFNIGLRNLNSATIVFRYPEDGVLYKYIAQNRQIESAGYMRVDGWCIPNEDNGNWHLMVNDPDEVDPNTQPLDDKFLFDLENDIGENNNILRNDLNKYDADKLVDYAVSLIQPYLDHPLYSEYILGLWYYMKDEDRTEQGEDWIHPWLSKKDYLTLVHKYLDIENNHRDNAISDELRSLYTDQWVPPNGAVLDVDDDDDDNELVFSIPAHSVQLQADNVQNNIYVYAAIAGAVSAAAVAGYIKHKANDASKYQELA